MRVRDEKNVVALISYNNFMLFHLLHNIMRSCWSAHLWFLSILSCPDVTYSSNIKYIHFIILIDPIQIEAMHINFEGDGRAWSGVLRKKGEENLQCMKKDETVFKSSDIGWKMFVKHFHEVFL